MEDIGQRLKEFIEEKELSVLAFSESVGIQRSSLSHIFSGRNKPSIDLLLKIKLKYPEIDLDWLISGEERIQQSNSQNTDDEGAKTMVTNVNRPSVVSDYEGINPDDKNENSESSKDSEIEKILILNKDGSFSVYKNS